MKRAARNTWVKEHLNAADRRLRDARRAFDRERTREAMDNWLEEIWEFRGVAFFYASTRLRREPMPPPVEEFKHVM